MLEHLERADEIEGLGRDVRLSTLVDDLPAVANAFRRNLAGTEIGLESDIVEAVGEPSTEGAQARADFAARA